MEERVDRTMFAKNLNDNIIQGDVQWKRVETYKTNPKGYGMPKSNPNDEGLKPVKVDAYNTINIEKVCTEKQLMEDPSDTLEKVSALEKTPTDMKPKSVSESKDPNDSELNHVGKILEKTEKTKPNSHGLDLNYVGEIPEINLTRETAKDTFKLDMGEGV